MRRIAGTLLPFCAAVFLAVYLVPDGWYVTAGIACLLLSVVALFCRGKARVRVLLTTVGLCLGFLWCGAYYALWCAPVEAYFGENRTVFAQVISYPERTGGGVSVTARIRMESGRSFRVDLRLKEGYEDLTLGDEIIVTADFSTAEVVHDREVSYYTGKGIRALGRKGKVKQLTHPEHLSWTLYPQKLAHWIQGNLDALYSGDSGGLLKALVTGEKDSMSEAFRSALSRTGLSHMTAVSGMHMALLVELLLLLPGSWRWKAVTAVPVMYFFALLTGMSPSVVRAAVMETALLMGPITRKQYDPISALSVALFLLLVQNPWAAGSVSLQLSFGAVTGIHLLKPRLLPDWRDWKKELHQRTWLGRRLWHVRRGVALTLSAMAFTVPLSVFYFDTVSVIAPVSNLLVVWCVSLLMGGGLITGVLYGIWPLAGMVLAWPVRILTWYVIAMVKALSMLSFAALQGDSPWIRFWLMAAYVLLALYCLRKPKGWRALIPAAGTAALLVFALAVNRSVTLRGDLTTGVLDVGQGQCVVLISGGKAIAVDCGGSGGTEAGETLANYLNQLSIVRLEQLVLTHYDSDHTNGIGQLLERVPVGSIVGPDVEDDTDNRAKLEALAREHGVSMDTVSADTTVSFGEARAQIFAPVSLENDNDASLSVLASAGDFDVLITGDMDSEVEEALSEEQHLSDVEVLVVGHHGSRYSTSTEFLTEITPQVAVISVGDNSYGHPTQDVLDRLEAAQAEVYRTDLNGTVTINDQ